MRVLLDTNILIHRETATVVRDNIGILFHWLDRLHYEKCVHSISVEEIGQHGDPRVRRSFAAKLNSYTRLNYTAPTHEDVAERIVSLDRTQNDRNDTALVNELYQERVDAIISEDRGVNEKAQLLGIADKVFTIDAFLEKVTAENPELVDYRVLAVRKAKFGEIDVTNNFFDSFREDYPGFDRWFGRKADEPAYVCEEDNEIKAFLYLKVEGEGEPYGDIEPTFEPKKRLKIGTLKVDLNGYKIGERFLKIVFDNAVRQDVDEIYVTIFKRSIEQERLIHLLADFGFAKHGVKGGEELVYTRSMSPTFNSEAPKTTFPYLSLLARAFLVPIYPQYHTELLPDSILRTESPDDFVEHYPHRNSIRKVYVSRSYYRDLQSGDIIIFYRTAAGGHAYYQSVVTTVGIVERVHLSVPSEEKFVSLCRKGSVFSDDELRKHWNWNPGNRPFIVEFLYAYSFPRRPNLKSLIDNGVIRDTGSAPRGFERITADQFATILRLSETDRGLIVD